MKTHSLKRVLSWLTPRRLVTCIVPLALVAVLGIAGFAAEAPSPTGAFGKGRTSISVKETPLWEVDIETRTYISDDWSHAAWVVKDGDKVRVVFDGKPGPKFDSLGEFSRQQDPVRVTNRGCVYVGITAGKWFCVSNGLALGPYEEPNYRRRDVPTRGPRPIFVRSGQVVLCPMWRRGKWVVVVEGREYGEYDNVWMPSGFQEQNSYLGPMNASASPDGRRWAFAAERGGRWLVVCDGVEGPLYDRVVDKSLVWSSDGGHFAYIAERDKALASSSGRRYLPTLVSVLDGVEGALEYPFQEIAFSADGKQCAYLICEQAAGALSQVYSLVRDGTKGPGYNYAYGLTLSPDGRRFAFLARRGEQNMVVDDAGEHPVTHAEEILMSADGAHFAWFDFIEVPRTRHSGTKRMAVVDGVAWEPFEGALRQMASFGAGGRFAYLYSKMDRDILVVDGKEVAAAWRVAGPVWSSDGRHVAWQVSEYDTPPNDRYQKPSRVMLYVDGVAVGDSWGTMSFTPDSRHIVTFAIGAAEPAAQGQSVVVGIDGVPHPLALDLPSGLRIDLREGAASFLCNRAGRYVRVDVTVTSEPEPEQEMRDANRFPNGPNLVDSYTSGGTLNARYVTPLLRLSSFA